MDSGSSLRERGVAGEVEEIRLRILNLSLLVAVALGGLAYVRVLVDSVDLQAWGIAVVATAAYGGLILLLLARGLPYRLRVLGFLAILLFAGVYGLLATGYLPTPILILVAENLLAAVLFGRRATWVAFSFNLAGLLIVGFSLSTGIATLETTTFYDPTDFVDWLRITAVFAVFCGVAVVSVDVLTRHMEDALAEQSELLANLKGAMQLHDEADRHRREAESRLREATGSVRVRSPNGGPEDVERALGAIADKAELLRTQELDTDDIRQLATEIEDAARRTAATRRKPTSSDE